MTTLSGPFLVSRIVFSSLHLHSLLMHMRCISLSSFPRLSPSSWCSTGAKKSLPLHSPPPLHSPVTLIMYSHVAHAPRLFAAADKVPLVTDRFGSGRRFFGRYWVSTVDEREINHFRMKKDEKERTKEGQREALRWIWQRDRRECLLKPIS